jgi:ubiquinone/menaquinone biosynthesis C-methylase UbiE
VKEYYDRRAPEYDDWYHGDGLFASRHRPGWSEAVAELERAVAALPAARTLDMACGTGFLTRHLHGPVTGLDQSEQMLAIARARVPHGEFVAGDALSPPFDDDAFDRVITGHFYGHLQPLERARFLSAARRLAPELIVIDSARRPDHEPEECQERVLNDGARFQVFKRFFTRDELLAELGGGSVLLANDWFVMVTSPRRARVSPPAPVRSAIPR